MPETPFVMFSINAAAFRASGEAEQLRSWLAARRPDMTDEARRQIVHHAAKFIQTFGREAPQLIQRTPEEIRERVAALDLPSHGLARHVQRHLRRAALALHAAESDLDAASTRQIMDHRTPQQGGRGSRRRARDVELPSGDLLIDFPDAAPSESRLLPEPGAGEPEAAAVAYPDVPAQVQPVLNAVNAQIAAQRQLEAHVDVRSATRAALAPLSASTRLDVAAQLPGTARVPVALDSDRVVLTLAQAAEEAICAWVADRWEQSDGRNGGRSGGSRPET